MGSVAVLAAIQMAACSNLPGTGPSSSAMVSPEASRPAPSHDGYLVADLDERVAQVLAAQAQATLKVRFGDYRPAPVQLIGVGDAVTVTIWEAAGGGLFSSGSVGGASPGSHTATIPEQIVARDGAITVPYAGRVQVVGLPPYAVEKRIVDALAGKAIDPQAIVTVSKNVASTVAVGGDAVNGSRVPITVRGDRVLEVIAAAGGARTPASITVVTLTRGGRSASVGLQQLIDVPRENIYVRPDDIISVARDTRSFTVFGATGQNSVVPFEFAGLTLEQAIAKGGGLIDKQADPAAIFLMRVEPVEVARLINPAYPLPPGRSTVNVVYRLNLRDPNAYFFARKVAMRDKDIVYVANANLAEIEKFLTLLQTATQPVLVARTLAR